MENLKRVCLCGRPNVGKSSLFNRLIAYKKALVLNEPGVTRDVVRKKVEWDDCHLELADLAGLEFLGQKQNPLQQLSVKAAIKYLESADLILFVVDARAGLLPEDRELSNIIRSKGKPVLLVLSKVEGHVEEQAQIEVAELGWGSALPTSAEHNLSITTLKEEIIKKLNLKPKQKSVDDSEQIHKEKPIRFGVYGRPNVGKSTLVNWLIGEKRMITSPIAGTTVDTIDSLFERGDKKYLILDTAGIRRKSKTEQGVEVLSVVQAIKSIKDIDVALFLIDGFVGVTDQDEKVAGEIIKSGKPIIILVNKWDLCKISKETYATKLRETLGFLDFAPVLFISAESETGIDPLWDLVDEILLRKNIVAQTSELNRLLERLEQQNNPMGLKIYYASQTSKNPPTITCIINHMNKVHFAFERYLRKEIREHYGWIASPVRIIFKQKKKKVLS